MKRLLLCLFVSVLSAFASFALAAEAPPAASTAKPQHSAAAVDFNRDVVPILSNNCFKCHGPDATDRKAKLRLDVADIAMKPAESGSIAIVPGEPDKSELVQRIFSDDDDERMPPPKSNKHLTDAQRQTLKLWIAQGAVYKRHWAYVAPERPVPPAQAASQAKNAIDDFVLAKLKQQNLQPSAEADRITLIRRLYFDLIGLPPSPEQVAQFVNDRDPQAYEKLVDRLLSSEHFGERMAIYWLDLVRYADSGGYHSDNGRDVYLYRDYVIAAFNANKPFDRFTIEQLAGDLLPDASVETRIASGYNRLLLTTEEGGAQAKEYTAKYAADRVRNISSVWLGSTMGCCECHDHKFDPFKTRDFYSMEAFFADVKETAVGRQEETPMPAPAQAAELKQVDADLGTARKALDTQAPALDASQAAWEETVRNQTIDWTPLRPTTVAGRLGTSLKVLDDASILAGGSPPERDTYTFVSDAFPVGATGLRLEALADPSLPANGPGRAANGNFVLTQITLEAGQKPGAEKPIGLQHASADFSQKDFNIATAVDGKYRGGWAILPEAGKPHVAIFEIRSAPGDAKKHGGNEVRTTIRLNFSYGTEHSLGHFRFSTTTHKPPLGDHFGGPTEIVRILDVEPAKRTAQQRQSLSAYYRSIAPELQAARAKVAALERKKTDLSNAFPKTLVTTAVAPRTVRILPRGNWQDDSGEVVSPAVPAFLLPLEVKDRRLNRLDLARWLVDRRNPLVARVFVNRMWMLLFGQGIVKTSEDFGSQGAEPSHPELLDWLATDFVASGWNVKHLLKTIAMSATYRQSSTASEPQRQQDPDDHWLARQGCFRLDAELIRDNALAVSGLLSPKIGGPSVKPYQPAGYWAYLNFPTREWANDRGENQYRRGLYTWWQRTFLQPSLKAFDAPTREECTAARTRSNTPLQSLVLLNDPTYVEAARVFAVEIVKEGGEMPAERIDWAFRRALSRSATPEERHILLDLYNKHHEEYLADKEAAKKLLGVGEAPTPPGLDPSDLAAWTSVARIILNLHETITRS